MGAISLIKLEIDIDDLNYDDLMEQYLPVMAEKLRASGNPVAMLISNGMPAAMAKKIVAGLSQDKKDALAADLLNAYSQKLIDAATAYAVHNGVGVTISKIHACGE